MGILRLGTAPTCGFAGAGSRGGSATGPGRERTTALASHPGHTAPGPRSAIIAAHMAATILIVEDEAPVARGIQFALQQEGYEVVVARTGTEGLSVATNQAPDLIVLDVRLPEMDGFEVLRRLRSAGSKARS